MSLKLKGRYKPEEILRIGPENKSYLFTRNEHGEQIKAIILPEECTIIENESYEIRLIFPNLREVIWPKIEKMESGVFGFCKKLKYFQTTSCQSFAATAFTESGLTSIKLPSNLGRLEESCFDGCKSLSSVDMTEVKSRIDILDCCFSDCTKLTEFDFSKCGMIGKHAFKKTKIKTAIIPSYGYCSIGSQAFWCSGLEYLEILGDIYLHPNCFEQCEKLKEVKLNPSIKSLPGHAFNNDFWLSDISGAESIESVGEYCFSYCSLTSLDCFPSLKEIDYYAFAGNDFEEITVNANVIKKYAFSVCSGLKKATLTSPEIKDLPYSLFHNDKITFLDIEQTGISVIKRDQFTSYNDIEEIKLPKKLKKIESNAFSNTKLARIVIPNTVTYIGISAFASCQCLEEVVWSSACPIISPYTFSHCCNIKSLIGSECIESIGDCAFETTSINLNFPNLKRASNLAFSGNYKGTANLRESSVIISTEFIPDNVLLPYYYYDG